MTKKIVVIDDEPSLSRMYRFKLETKGYKVKTANNGLDGIKLINSFKPDLLLLDVMMPYETGDVTLRKIRKTKFGKNLKVLVMTNTDMQEAPKGIQDLNFQGYVVKVYMTPEQVANMVELELARKDSVPSGA